MRVGGLEDLDHGELAVALGAQPGREQPAAGIGGTQPGEIGTLEVDRTRLAAHVLDHHPQAERLALLGQAQPCRHAERCRHRDQDRLLLAGLGILALAHHLVDLDPAAWR